MSSSSEEDIFVICALKSIEDEEKRRKRKRIWVHPINTKREDFGEFHHLFDDLKRDDEKFFNYFRMTQNKFKELLNMLEPHISRRDTVFRRAVTSEERLAVCLRYVATGNSFISMAYNYRLGKTTIREIVLEVCKAIWDILQPAVMPQMTSEMWIEKENQFQLKWHFPNCVGAIDGKHVTIKKPNNSGSLFYNYKGTCSIVLMAVVDADCKFTLIDVGEYGKNSDGGIFSNCSFGKKLLSGKLNLPPDKTLPGTIITQPHIIVGDEAFPLHRNLMRPYPGSQLRGHSDKKIFNYRLSRARNVSENAFGQRAAKFRIHERRLNLSPECATTVVAIDDFEGLFRKICVDEEAPAPRSLSNLIHVSGFSRLSNDCTGKIQRIFQFDRRDSIMANVNNSTREKKFTKLK